MLKDVISEHPPPTPITDDYSRKVIDDALASLGTMRGLQWLDDGAGQLHLLASLRDEIGRHITEAAALALSQDYTWDEITQLLGHDDTNAVERRYANTDRGGQPTTD